jgi:hypothetical protein
MAPDLNVFEAAHQIMQVGLSGFIAKPNKPNQK